MPATDPTATPPASTAISLDTVSAEIKFIANFMADLTGRTASKADKDRITALLDAAQADLAAAATIVKTRIGQDPVIGPGETKDDPTQ